MPDGSAIPGRFRFTLTPYLRGILDATVDKNVVRIVCRKSAQIGWTDGMICNLIAYLIAVDPRRIIVLFPREKTAIDFNDEKLEPMVDCCDALAERILLTSRKEGNRQLFKKFPGGFLKLVASNSPGEVKSTSAPLVIVEEPDDCNLNVRGQGDSIKLAEERAKAYHNALIVIGGTPTMRDNSAIDAEMEKTDKCFWMVPCHHCGTAERLEWDQLRWHKTPDQPHHIHGKHHPETAHYVCASCGGIWNDVERLRNIRKGKWVATAPFAGARGFDGLNELYSPFKNARMEIMAAKFLEAHRESEAGNAEKLITFTNTSLGKSYAYASDLPSLTDLEDRAEDYEERTVPAGGLALSMGIDSQHDRLAITIWAIGRDMERWLVFWGEEYGAVANKSDPVWTTLTTAYLDADYRCAGGGKLKISAASIDSGDGQTSDAVYDWVREHRHHSAKVMAVKGRLTGEIYAVPQDKSIDPRYGGTKASRYGVKVYMVNTERAKDLLLGYTTEGGCIKRCDRAADGSVRTGSGAGRMHWYRGVRADFFEQLADSEVKAPGVRAGKRVWTKKTGKRNEALDCAVYAEHAARALRLNLNTESEWDRLARAISVPTSDKPKPPTEGLRIPGGFPITSAVVR